MSATRTRPVKVTRMMDEDGFVVSGTDDVEAAREQARTVYRADLESDGWDGDDLAEHLARIDDMRPRIGWYRWNPCHESSCYDGGGHSGHLGYVDGPGRGNFRGVYLQGWGM